MDDVKIFYHKMSDLKRGEIFQKTLTYIDLFSILEMMHHFYQNVELKVVTHPENDRFSGLKQFIVTAKLKD